MENDHKHNGMMEESSVEKYFNGKRNKCIENVVHTQKDPIFGNF
jgi:hypothetical protein